ncbi:hypothetical protein F5Y18DRAFT_375502 [Xylariaceae sp. FL1019]|nr:hypothetical protein F5Y18DRAFT_375502 [Xylariaceae sp. FL1019]
MSSPPRRRSARIASTSKRSKASPSPQLESLTEAEEPAQQDAPRLPTIMSSPAPHPKTPSSASPVKVPMSEMHPSRVHPTTAPPSSALRHGFTDIDYTAPPAAMGQNTPSKTTVPSSDFTFRHVRSTGESSDGESHLGPAARKMMEELRGEAAQIKAQLAADRARELAENRESADGRKIAAAKGRAGRYSAAHLAEFKKMDSIEGHPSAYRAAPGRFPPVKNVSPLKHGVKRSQSKANLNEPDSPDAKTGPSRFQVRLVEQTSATSESPSKRIRQRIEDDTSTFRPMSRDGSSIPRPKSSGNDSLRSAIPRPQTLANISTPTKSSLARTNSVKSAVNLMKSPSKSGLGQVRSFSARLEGAFTRSPTKPELGQDLRSPGKKGFGGLTQPATASNLAQFEGNNPTHVQTPGRFDRVKSILKRQVSGPKSKPSETLSPAKTPSHHASLDKMLPPLPLTTPGRKHDRRVAFTSETKRAAMAQNSPSPIKSGIPRSTTLAKLPAPDFTTSSKTIGKTQKGEVMYPDLSAYGAVETKQQSPPESVPSTFTFRSDHTISFRSSPSKGFGSAHGQASLRHVRESIIPPARMPGAFPDKPEVSLNKENDDPAATSGIPHGLPNKKRSRAGTDEDEEDEGAKRGMKKLRKDAPAAEGHAVVAPRLVGQTSPAKKSMTRGSLTPSPQKKKTGLSMSRLNMLARPKVRK